jgi:hypothetical protein
VTLNDNGCVASDNVLVRVVDEVTLSTAPDTTICLTDPVMLQAFGDGLRYEWTPSISMNDPFSKSPFVTPTANTIYTVTSRIGNCFKSDEIMVRTVPYPGANAGSDLFICYDDTTQLNATIAGSAFTWTPANTLIDAQTLNPLAHPRRSTSYVLTVTDNIGCPKPGRDTVFVGVRPPVRAFAGNDTSIVVGQPLQLKGSLNLTSSGFITGTARWFSVHRKPVAAGMAGSVVRIRVRDLMYGWYKAETLPGR